MYSCTAVTEPRVEDAGAALYVVEITGDTCARATAKCGHFLQHQSQCNISRRIGYASK